MSIRFPSLNSTHAVDQEWRQRAKPEQEAYRKSRAEYDQRVKDAFGKQKKPAAVEGEKKERKKRAPQAAL